MANEWYREGVKRAAEAGWAWSTNSFKLLITTSAYTPNTAAGGDAFVSNIPGASIIARSAALSGKTNSGGTLDFATATFSLVPSGHTIVYCVLYLDTGNDATSILLVKYDTGNALPLDTNGQDVNFQTDSGPNRAATL